MKQRLIRHLQVCRNLMELKQIYLQILVTGSGNSNSILPRLSDNFSVLKSLNSAIQIPGTSQAFKIYNEMRSFGVSPDRETFALLLNACRPSACLSCCEQMHAQSVKCGFGSAVFVQNVLLSVYSRCAANPISSRRVFDEMLEKDVVSWNSMISACMKNHRDMKQAIELFNLMPVRNIVSWNSVITALSKAGEMALARSFFDRMGTRNTVSWNAMVAGYVAAGDVESARSIFEQEWDKDVVSWTAMISGNAGAGDMESANKLFEIMPMKNAVSWAAIISGYAKNSRFDEALALFHLMLLDGKCLPNEPTLVTVISAIARLGCLERGIWINSYIEKAGIPRSTPLGNALIDMFAKCGQIKNSESVFDQMTGRCVITWTTMISGLAFNGKCIEAVALFHRFCREGLDPDDVVFIAALSACAHGGLVEEGHKIFGLMAGRYGVKPRIEHYGCMVDLLGRAGKFKEAVAFICSMPGDPNVVIWATLLSSCIIHGAFGMAECVNQKVKDCESLEPGYRVLVSNYSARAGGWNHVTDVRARMREMGIEKAPGCSSIRVGGEVHEFLVRDSEHRMMGEIYEALDGLAYHMRQMGCMPLVNLPVL